MSIVNCSKVLVNYDHQLRFTINVNFNTIILIDTLAENGLNKWAVRWIEALDSGSVDQKS